MSSTYVYDVRLTTIQQKLNSELAAVEYRTTAAAILLLAAVSCHAQTAPSLVDIWNLRNVFTVDD